MNTKQHNTKPVERTFCASGLLGRPSQRRIDWSERFYLGQDASQVMGTPAGMLGDHGSTAVSPSIAIFA